MRDVAVVAGDQRGDEQPTPLTQRPRGGRSSVRRPAANSAHEDPPVPTPWLICIKAVDGGLFVALFAVIGEMLQPKRFAGIFGASPAVSLANLLVIALVEGDGTARKASDGMIAGAIALAVASGAAIPAVRRWGAVLGSAVLWAVWIAVGVAVGFPLAGGAGGAAGGRPGAGPGRGQQKTGDDAGPAGGSEDDRLFAVDFRALREIPFKALVWRFVFGAAISVVAGLIGVLVGPRAGGVMLASPAVLPATLTIIERQEGRGPAVAEVMGAVPGAVALTGFALVAAGSMTKLPLAAALLLPLVTWVVAAIGGYLALAKLLPAWAVEVRRLAFQRRGLALVRRAQAGSGARQAVTAGPATVTSGRSSAVAGASLLLHVGGTLVRGREAAFRRRAPVDEAVRRGGLGPAAEFEVAVSGRLSIRLTLAQGVFGCHHDTYRLSARAWFAVTGGACPARR